MGRDFSTGPSSYDPRMPLVSSWTSNSPLAEQALAQDLAECSDDDLDYESSVILDGDDDMDYHDPTGPMFRRPSGVAFGGTRPILNPATHGDPGFTQLERKQSHDAERSLLRDNHILPPKHKGPKSQNVGAKIYRKIFSTKLPLDEERPLFTERDPLLAESSAAASLDETEIEQRWEQAVASGKLRTTWQRETMTIGQYSAPLIMTFFLQYSINVASIFAVGRIGKIELGAVSLANMSAAITCLAPFQGLATSLDTLCAQAFGSGHKHLVGLQVQRMAYFLFTLTLPVALIWWFSENLLRPLVPDPESARLAGSYLRVMILSIPGFIFFECGKRFTQAQGLFRATTYILIVAAPFNVFIIWLLVWHFDFGFIGAPIGVVITQNILPILLFLYVRFIDGSQCWGGFNKRALSNWWVMIRLALPGMIMVEAEWLAFEIMTLLASRFGSEYLAAQSVVATLATIAYQIPFPVSIAASTRIANLIGAGLVPAAKTAAKVAFYVACFVGVFNLAIFGALRYSLPLLFTDDEEVIAIVAKVLPVVAIMQVIDGISAGAHGTLRGLGKQSIGGPANLIAYYVISLPISLGLAFGLDWRLEGLWAGVTVGLVVVSLIEYIYILRTNWDACAAEAQSRNEMG